MEQKVELPDFDDIFDLMTKIKNISLRLASLELKLDNDRAVINRTVTTYPIYFINGKPPSQDYIKSTFFVTGLNGELVPIREEISKLEIELDYLKKTMDVIKIQIDIWRTQSANSRKTVI